MQTSSIYRIWRRQFQGQCWHEGREVQHQVRYVLSWMWYREHPDVLGSWRVSLSRPDEPHEQVRNQDTRWGTLGHQVPLLLPLACWTWLHPSRGGKGSGNIKLGSGVQVRTEHQCSSISDSFTNFFSKYDLYTKSTKVPDIEKLKPYYQSLIDKYLPGVVDFWINNQAFFDCFWWWKFNNYNTIVLIYYCTLSSYCGTITIINVKYLATKMLVMIKFPNLKIILIRNVP